MGQIETCGPQATELLQRLLSGDLRKLPVGGAQYGLICREDGGVLDDVITYRLAECEYLTVSNAANHARDLAWFSSHARGYDADVIDLIDRFAMLAVQGPQARAVVGELADGALPAADARLRAIRRPARPVTICGTGYTGEDGVELLLDPADAPAVWDALITAGAVPAGLGARDTLTARGLLSAVRERADRSSADRLRPDWAGAARRRPASSAQRPSPAGGNRILASPRSNWWRSCSTDRGSRGRAIRSARAGS